MNDGEHWFRQISRREALAYGVATGAAAVSGAMPGFGSSPAGAEGGNEKGQRPRTVFATTVAYVGTFYPLWFYYYQSQLQRSFGDLNRLVGPDRISPLYQVVVAINDDTLYANGFVDVTAEPLVLTIPGTSVSYSISVLDPYGNILDVDIPSSESGVFALTGPGFAGTLPGGVVPVPTPLNFFLLNFRADKFSNSENMIGQAQCFRATLRTLPLSDYEKDPSGGSSLIRPEAFFAEPFKTTADTLIAEDPIEFLRQLQTAVASSNTPPLSRSEQALSDAFDRRFARGRRPAFARGARAAHQKILDTYLDHLGPTNWIHFTNIGDWRPDEVFQRAAITEFLQVGNGIKTAAYYHTFKDGEGRALDGSNGQEYVLTFPAGQLPQAERFWSVTAYTPESIELIHTPAYKYVVASYTDGLEFNADGSLSISMAVEQPEGVPLANWLPVADGPFNIMLRIYGPEDDTYVPPAVR